MVTFGCATIPTTKQTLSVGSYLLMYTTSHLVDMVDVDTSQPMTEFRKSLLQEHRDYIADQLSAIDQVVVFFAYSGLIYKGLAESVTVDTEQRGEDIKC